MKTLLKISKLLSLIMVTAWLVTYLALRFEGHQYRQLSPAQLDQAKAYIEGKLTPLPDRWHWDTFSSEPGVELRTGVIDAPNAKGTVVIVPGFTATIEMVMREIVTLNNAGYRVASIEYRGQGESYRPLANPEKGYVESYAKLAEEVAEFAKQERIPNKPLFFYSISKGGHITMRMAGEQNLEVAGYVLIVPMIQVNTGGFSNSSTRKIAGVLHHLGLGTMYAPGQKMWPNGELEFGKAIDCNANPTTAQTREAIFALRETSRTNGVTLSWVYRSTASTEKILSASHMANISEPVRMFTAGIDTLVNTDVAQQFCADLANCEVQHFAESRHCITREDFATYDGILADAISFFDQQTSN